MVERIKDFLIKILSPLAFIAGFIYFFIRKPTPGITEEDKKYYDDHAETIRLEGEADRKSTDSLSAYENAVSDYLKSKQ